MKFIIKTLGCKVNNYESEMIHEELIAASFSVVKTYKEAEVIIINTCTVTNNADSKSMQTIRRARKENDKAILIICGCIAESKKENLEEIDADIIIGNYDKSKILEYINEYKQNKKKIISLFDLTKSDFEDMEVINYNSKTRAFVKIQDGCENYCAYCIIPFVRGNLRSKNFDLAVNEIGKLSSFHKEIVLTGIHTGSYNSEGKDLTDLIKEISKIDSLKRIRISSIEITEINDKFLSELKNNSKICDHLHIPLQSGSNEILKKMNRKYDLIYFINKIEDIKKIRPNISITTDLIVGFPGEEEKHYLETIETLKHIGFSKVHVFPYSIRQGTLASKMSNQVPNNIKKARAKEVTKLSSDLETSYAKKFIDKKVEVLIESVNDEFSIGHTSNYLEVKINHKLDLNEMYQIEIVAVNNGEIIGKIS